MTNFDSSFIAQCRSHKGCLVYLTQSVSSFYSAMKGESGKHEADALLANFSHVIVHASDPVTSKWAVSKLGRKRLMLFSGSSTPQGDASVWDHMFGENRASASFSEHYEQVLQDQEFMIGRTGGPLITSNTWPMPSLSSRGNASSNGESYLAVVFKCAKGDDACPTTVKS